MPGFAKDGEKNVKMKDGKGENVLPVSAAEYNPCGWRDWLNNTTITLGMQNVLDADPSFVAGSFENGYDESLATIKGRFWYVQLKRDSKKLVQLRLFFEDLDGNKLDIYCRETPIIAK